MTELPYVLKVAVGGRNQRMREHWRAKRIRLETAVARQHLRTAIHQAEKSGVEFVVPQYVCRSETVCCDTAAAQRRPVSTWHGNKLSAAILLGLDVIDWSGGQAACKSVCFFKVVVRDIP